MSQRARAEKWKEALVNRKTEELKETMVQTISLRLQDQLHDPALIAEHLIEMNSSLTVDQIPSDISGTSIYQRENVSYTAAMGALIAGDKVLEPALRAALVKLIKDEIKGILLNMAASRYRMKAHAPPESLEESPEEWAKTLALVREEYKQWLFLDASPNNSQPNEATEKQPQTEKFKVVLNNFTNDESENFVDEYTFVYHFHMSFEKLLDMLRFRTQARHKPPQEPRPNFKPISPKTRAEFGFPAIQRSRSNSVSSDQSVWDDSIERPSLEYSDGVLARAEDDISGYTLKDGPWIYQLLLDGKDSWGPQHLLASQRDFQRMISSLIDIKKRTPDIELMVDIIHSQDRIGVKRWKKQQRENDKERKQLELDAFPFDQEEFERVIQLNYGHPWKERMVEGLEDILSHRRNK